MIFEKLRHLDIRRDHEIFDQLSRRIRHDRNNALDLAIFDDG